MSSWTEGYVEGLDYVHVYTPEFNPMRVGPNFLYAGVVAPKIRRVCELGFGQGWSANIYAAASTIEWFGTDFNPAQASYAQEVAAASGAAATFVGQSFAEFCSRSDLPDFDYIVLHGVWSWTNDENRALIVDFIRRKLTVGGVLYVSYNTPPGDAAFMPIREVLIEHAEWMGAPAHDMTGRIDGALSFADELIAACPDYAKANPQIVERLEKMKGKGHSYVAHEYFNRDWAPMSFARMTEWLEPAKLSYACSANFSRMLDEWNLSPEQQALLARISDTKFRETVRDVMLGTRFRRDYWVKGLRRLTLSDRLDRLRRLPVIFNRPRSLAAVKATALKGIFEPPSSIGNPILDAIADYQPRTLGQIEQAVKGAGIDFTNVLQATMTMIETGDLSSVQSADVVEAARKQTDRLNAFHTEQLRYRVGLSALASPVTGGGILEAGRALQFFWHAVRQGKIRPADVASHAAQMLRMDDVAVPEEDKLLVLLQSLEQHPSAMQAVTFFTETTVPLFKALQIV